MLFVILPISRSFGPAFVNFAILGFVICSIRLGIDFDWWFWLLTWKVFWLVQERMVSGIVLDGWRGRGAVLVLSGFPFHRYVSTIGRLNPAKTGFRAQKIVILNNKYFTPSSWLEMLSFYYFEREKYNDIVKKIQKICTKYNLLKFEIFRNPFKSTFLRTFEIAWNLFKYFYKSWNILKVHVMFKKSSKSLKSCKIS